MLKQLNNDGLNFNISDKGNNENFLKRFFIIRSLQILLLISYLGFSKLFKKKYKLFDYSTLHRKLSEEGYKYYFLLKNFRKAYFYRIKYAITLEKLGNHTATNYLNTVYSDELLDYIKLNTESRNYLKKREIKNVLKFKSKKKYKTKSILYLGPLTDFDNINNLNYDMIVINKPVNLSKIKNKNKPVILMLNNIFSISKKEKIKIWYDENDFVDVFSPIDIDININSRVFDLIPKFPFNCGLMGLQRTLTIIFNICEFETIQIQGFDFMLSKLSYHPSYPSLLKYEFDNDVNLGILKTNMKHDFLLNYMFVKRLYNNYPNIIIGDIVPFLEMKIEDTMFSFKKRF